MTHDDVVQALRESDDLAATYAQVLDRPRWKARLESLPARMQPGLIRWVLLATIPGDFLTCVLRNDLRAAVLEADDQNRLLLPLYVEVLLTAAPADCWGSRELVDTWRGITG